MAFLSDKLMTRFISGEEDIQESTSHLVSVSGKKKFKIFVKRRKWHILAVALLIIILLVILLIVLLRKGGSKKFECYRCHTILSYTNLQANPCVDFYEYACGNFSNIEPRPPGKKKWSSRIQAVENFNQEILEMLKNREIQDSDALVKVYDYFQMCVDTPSLNFSPLLEVVRKVGGWPLLGEEGGWSESKWKLQDSIQVALSYQCFPLLRLKLVQVEGTIYPAMAPPELTPVGFRDQLAYKAFKMAVESSWQTLRSWKLSQKRAMNAEETEKVKDMWMLEEKLDELIRNPSESSYGIETLGSMAKLFKPWLDFKMIFSTYFGASVKDDEKVIVKNVGYFKRLQTMVSVQSRKMFGNYIAWSVVNCLTINTILPFNSSEDILNRIRVRGKRHSKKTMASSHIGVLQTQKLSREMNCVKEVLKKFPYALASSYVKSQYDYEEIKEEGEDMCARLIEAAKKHLPHFFDRETVEKAEKKLSKMKCAVGYPSFILNASSLNFYYKEFEPGETYLQNSINYRFFTTKLLRRQFASKKNPFHNWDSYSIEVNARFSFSDESLEVLPGLFQPPFYYYRAPFEVRWGSLGMILAKELTHALLKPGHELFSKEMAGLEWSENTKDKFEIAQKCYVKEFNKLEAFSKDINERLNVEESIADSGGLWQAFQALLEEYGGEEDGWSELEEPTSVNGIGLNRGQLFFVTYAQQWCSNHEKDVPQKTLDSRYTFGNIRMQATLQNSKEFATVFKCPPGGPYNPAHKCSI